MKFKITKEGVQPEVWHETHEKAPFVVLETTTNQVNGKKWSNRRIIPAKDSDPADYCKQLLFFRKYIKPELPFSIVVPYIHIGCHQFAAVRWYELLSDRGQKSLGIWQVPKDVFEQIDFNKWDDELAEELRDKYYLPEGIKRTKTTIDAEDLELGEDEND